MLRFSIIIPCYQDEEELICLLEQLQELPHIAYEVIVVDGADSKHCQKICVQHKVHWLASKPCRGEQFLAGSVLAKGDVFWFLHADAYLPPDPLTVMTHALEQGAVGGYFRFRFHTSCFWPARVLEPAIALRCRLGVPYGDQGLFILRQAYINAGGHAPWPLFEEVPFVRGVRRLGEFRPLTEPIYADPRRWQRDGWWRRTWNNRKLALYFAMGVAPNKLALRYHADSRSTLTPE